MIYGNKIGGSRDTKTYIISMVDENNNEVFEATGVVVDKEEIFDASCEDVAVGRKFASEEGVMVGTNDFPRCRIVNGIHEVLPGVEFILKMENRNLWDYTTFHAIMWPKIDADNPTPKADKISVYDAVYDSNGVKIANVIKDAANMAVRFVLDNGDNLINNTEFSYLVYFSVCKDDLL